MKKLILILIIITSTINVSAQFEGNLKIGSTINSDQHIGGSAGLYLRGGFAYHFLADKRISIVPMVFLDKSGYTIDDLTFGGSHDNNGNFTTEFSTLTYQLYSLGIKVSPEVKFLNLDKKVNFYVAPSLGSRRIIMASQSSSNPNLGIDGSPSINQGFIIDWGFELGVKTKRLKIGLSLRDVLNKGNRSHSSAIITNAFGISVGYLFGKKDAKNKEIEEE